jgi:protein arginine kinase activator
MNCEKCHKTHATIHLTAIENGAKQEAHLCEECARASGVHLKFNLSIGDLLGTLMEPAAPAKASKAGGARCPECGITYAEFKSKARLGCAKDYEVFRGELLKLLEKIHGATTHAGKAPHTVDAAIRKENELVRLKKDLEAVVKSEDFEKAAQIRDRIRSLEHELNR